MSVTEILNELNSIAVFANKARICEMTVGNSGSSRSVHVSIAPSGTGLKDGGHDLYVIAHYDDHNAGFMKICRMSELLPHVRATLADCYGFTFVHDATAKPALVPALNLEA
jgi:hypothetical protein